MKRATGFLFCDKCVVNGNFGVNMNANEDIPFFSRTIYSRKDFTMTNLFLNLAVNSVVPENGF